MVTRGDGRVLLGFGAVATSLAFAAPLVVVTGASRFVAQVVLALGAWLVVGRVRSIDLSVAASAGAGAVTAGIVASDLGVVGAAMLPLAAVAGGFVGAAGGAVVGRVGRTAGAIASLCLGAGWVAVARAVPATGGRTGFHAVPLLAGGDRADLVVSTGVLVLAALLVVVLAASRGAARAAVAAAAPAVAASLGRRPSLDLAAVGAVGGAVLGVGGLLLATAGGSVLVDGFGAAQVALLALAGILAERLRLLVGGPILAVVAATAVLHLPGLAFPLVPLVGTVSSLATTGIVALALVALLRHAEERSSSRPPGALAGRTPTPPVPHRRARLEAGGLALVHGTVDLEVDPGEIVAVVGPNGAGKSTLLARLGGQLSGGAVLIGGGPAPRGAVHRARAGVARTWQRPPDVDPEDLVRSARSGAAVASRDRNDTDDRVDMLDGDATDDAVRWAASVLGDAGDDVARASLVGVAARRPAIVLLDEPAALLPADRVRAWVHGMAEGGAAVVLVEHRPEVAAIAHRTLEVGR